LLGLAAWGVNSTRHSARFVLREVESDGSYSLALAQKAAEPWMGRVSIFDVPLTEVEKRVRVDPWVESVTVSRRLPGTLRVRVVQKNAAALATGEKGVLHFMASDGSLIARATAQAAERGLPLVVGVASAERRAQALQLVSAWARNVPTRVLDGIAFDGEEGFRLWLTLGGKPIEILFEEGGLSSISIERIEAVLAHIERHAIDVRQIWVDSVKKIVVKLRHRS